MSYIHPHPQRRQPHHFCENEEHSTHFDLSLPPKLSVWPLWYLRLQTLKLWPCRTNFLGLSTRFKQTTKEHILSTQYPVLPKYFGFVALPFLAVSSTINMYSQVDK